MNLACQPQVTTRSAFCTHLRCGLKSFAGTLPRGGCIDQRRRVPNSWGFRDSVHIEKSGNRGLWVLPLRRSLRRTRAPPGCRRERESRQVLKPSQQIIEEARRESRRPRPLMADVFGLLRARTPGYDALSSVLCGDAERLVGRTLATLQVAELFPPPILLSLGGISVLVALQPKAEPIHATSLRGNSVTRI